MDNSINDFESEKIGLIEKVDQFINKVSYENDKRKKIAHDLLNHLGRRIELFHEEQNFQLHKNIQVKRGKVYWIDFGVNVGEEFGGKHPAIILRVGGNTAIVVPLSSQQPTEDQLANGTYVEVDKVWGFKKITRWANILNTMPISLMRFDFSNEGNVKGYVLDALNDASKKCGLYK